MADIREGPAVSVSRYDRIRMSLHGRKCALPLTLNGLTVVGQASFAGPWMQLIVYVCIPLASQRALQRSGVWAQGLS
jgi:hypothetical protein